MVDRRTLGIALAFLSLTGGVSVGRRQSYRPRVPLSPHPPLRCDAGVAAVIVDGVAAVAVAGAMVADVGGIVAAVGPGAAAAAMGGKGLAEG